jgi:hypothetical protein
MKQRVTRLCVLLCLMLVGTTVSRGPDRLQALSAYRGLNVVPAPGYVRPNGITQVLIRISDDQNRTPDGKVQVAIKGYGVTPTTISPTSNPFAINLSLHLDPRTPIPQGAGVTLSALTDDESYATAVPVTLPLGEPPLAEVSLPLRAVDVHDPSKPPNDFVAAGKHVQLGENWTAQTNPKNRAMLSLIDSTLVLMDHLATAQLRRSHHIFVKGQEVWAIAPSSQKGVVLETPQGVSIYSVGTRFLVRAAHGTTTVTDLAGLVIVQDRYNNTATLYPNEQAIAADGSPVATATATADVSALTSWAAPFPTPPIDHTNDYLLSSSAQSLVEIPDLQPPSAPVSLAQPRDVAVTPDGKAVYVATANGVYQLSADLSSPRELNSAAGMDSSAVAVTPNGATVVVGDNNLGSLDLLDPATDAITSTVSLGYLPDAAVISPLGADYSALGTDGPIAAVTGHRVDGSYWISLVDLQHSRVLMTQQVNEQAGDSGPAARPCFDVSGQLVYVPLPQEGSLRTILVAGLSWVASANADTLHGTPAAVAPSYDGKVYVGLKEGGVVKYDLLSTGQATQIFQSSDPVLAMAVAADGTLAVSTASAGAASLHTLIPQDGAGSSIELPPVTLGAPVTALAIYRSTWPADTHLLSFPIYQPVSSVPTVEAIPTCPEYAYTTRDRFAAPAAYVGPVYLRCPMIIATPTPSPYAPG